MKMKIKKTDPEQKKIVTKSIFDYLQNLKDNFTPKMKINTKELIFYETRYGDQKEIVLEIENEGDGLLEFEVFRMLNNSNFRNITWLHISPLRGVVKAGEKKQITFRISIGQREA